jgi:hypothetical protein
MIVRTNDVSHAKITHFRVTLLKITFIKDEVCEKEENINHRFRNLEILFRRPLLQ